MFTSPECRRTHLGREYMGTLNVTASGRTCQAWTSSSPHTPSHAASNDAEYPDGSRAAARNYCRNPDLDAGGPWCYTMDPNVPWESCNAPYCGESNEYYTLTLYTYRFTPVGNYGGGVKLPQEYIRF